MIGASSLSGKQEGVETNPREKADSTQAFRGAPPASSQAIRVGSPAGAPPALGVFPSPRGQPAREPPLRRKGSNSLVSGPP